MTERRLVSSCQCGAHVVGDGVAEISGAGSDGHHETHTAIECVVRRASADPRGSDTDRGGLNLYVVDVERVTSGTFYVCAADEPSAQWDAEELADEYLDDCDSEDFVTVRRRVNGDPPKGSRFWTGDNWDIQG